MCVWLGVWDKIGLTEPASTFVIKTTKSDPIAKLGRL
jgi:hypothetical protein